MDEGVTFVDKNSENLPENIRKKSIFLLDKGLF
jgi:hypothetical protein